ncbi:MAG: sterol carrier protein [Thermaerobacter sp.]|nr:sterol carrier protein [Thermaerobacter sp.]
MSDASKERLFAALDLFREKVNENARLRQMNRDWNRDIAVVAKDLVGVEASISMRAGLMEWQPQSAENPHIVLTAPADVLIGIFRGDSTPTEPYLDGSLTLRGTQEDVLRLDFVSLMIWGE